MTQQEFEHIYISIKENLMGLARQFCRSASIDLDAEDVVQEALIAFWELAGEGLSDAQSKSSACAHHEEPED